MMGDDPPYLAVGTDVSAKYKGAFCEAKIRKISRHVKCKVTFKSNLGLAPATIPDDQIRGTLRVGQVVEAKPDKDKNTYYEATITRIQDSSMYTVVFDDGDITTLRRSALCLKSGRHFNESETLDQLPLTHPEHFLNPVVGGRRGGRRRVAKNDADKDDSSDEEDTPSQKGKKHSGTHIAPGRVVYVENAEKKKGKENWFPGLIVSPCAQDTVKIRVKDECLVRSFKDGRYYTVPKKEITEFSKEQHGKWESISNPLKSAVEKAIAYLDKDELPPHWDRDVLFGNEDEDEDDDNNSDIEGSEARQQEENDLFLANLHRFHEESGTPFTKPPSICNKELDIGKLFKIVTDQGGHDKITNGGQWKNVTMKLGLGNMPSTSTVNLVKKNYKRFLYDYEKSSDSTQLSQQSSSSSKVRISRSQNRIGGALSSSKESVKKDDNETSKNLDEKDVKKSSTVEPEGDTASVDSTDTKKSEASSATNEEPRRSRSRQESRSLVKKESSAAIPDDKGTEGKKKSKKTSTKEKDKEETSSVRAEPPSPAPSSQGSKKGRGGSRKRKEKEDEDVTTKETPKLDESEKTEGLSKDVKIQVGDKLSVFYPNGDQPMTYEAKAIEMCSNRGYLVHYTGWNTRYDEWIKRDRISENLSLRANYQAKSQGKGPASQSSSLSVMKEKEKDKDKESEDKVDSEGGKIKSSSKKKGRTTPAPSPSVSSTGTRSKSGTVKRKRLSAEFEEPAKKKRSSKKSEKDTTQSESESENSDSEPKSEKDVKSSSSSLAVTPSRTGKSPKEKKATEESVEEVKAVSKDEEKSIQSSTTDSVDKDNPTQPVDVVDMAQIRSEMRGLHNIVKSKSAGSIPSASSGTGSQLQSTSSSVSVSGGQKLDIYDFEEELNDAPKLKMFSPRSPDKKDDGVAKITGDSSTPVVKSPSIDVSKLKDSTLLTTSSGPSSITKVDATPGAPKTTTAKVATASSATPRPPTPVGLVQGSNSKHSSVTASSGTPQALPKGLLAVSPAVTTSGQRISGVNTPQLTEVKVRMGVPVAYPQNRPRPPMSAAPSALVPCASLTTTARAATPPVIQGVGPNAGMPVHSGITQSQPVSISKRITKIPPAKPLLKPKPGLITPIVTSQATPAKEAPPVKDVAPAKDSKVLPPFQVRAQEVFPHLVQQENVAATGSVSSTIPVQTSEPVPEKLPALSYSGKSDKYGLATVLNIPTVKPISKTPSSESSKSEKQKRGPPKDKPASVTLPQPQLMPSAISVSSTKVTQPSAQQVTKKTKAEVTKPTLPPFPTQISKPSLPLPQKSDLKKHTKASSSEALSKINDTISNFMQTTDDKPSTSIKKKKSEKAIEEKAGHKEAKEKEGQKESKTKPDSSTARSSSSDKRSSPIKTHFLKESAPSPSQPDKSVPSNSDNLITTKTSVVVHKMKLDSRQIETTSTGDALKPVVVSTELRSPTVIIPVASTSQMEVKSKDQPQSVLQISKLSTVENSPVLAQPIAASASTSKLLLAKTNVVTTVPSTLSHVEKTTAMTPVHSTSISGTKPNKETPEEVVKPSPEIHLTRVKVEAPVVKDTPQSKESIKPKAPSSSVIPKESSNPPEPLLPLKIDTTTPTASTISREMDSADDLKLDVGKTVEIAKQSEETKIIITETKERPLTPSFLTAKEELAPDFEDEDETVLPKQRTSRRESTTGQKFSDSSKEDESCSSLLCEEEIPGSPTVDEEGRSKFDFVDDDDNKQEKTSLRDHSRADKSTKQDDRVAPKELKEDRLKTSRRDFPVTDDALSAMDKEFLGSQDHSSPSTPESTSMSVETGGSPNIEGRGISPSGEGGSSKSKESTDGESYSGDGYLPRKKSSDPSSPASKRTKDSRGRLSSPPLKRRRIPRKKSPEEVIRPIHRGRGSSSRKAQPAGSETPETIRAPIPPPPPFAPLIRPHVQSKWEHLIPNLDGVTDSEERALIIYNCMMKAKEKYLEIRAQELARERRLKRLRRKERERAAAEKQALKSQEVKVSQ